MNPVTRLQDLAVEVVVSRDHDGGPGEERIEIIDRRVAGEVISLPPTEAAALSLAIAAKFGETLATEPGS